MVMRAQGPGTRPQQGAALVIGLVLLMALTLLATASIRTASLELVMAGNTQYRERAFQLAQTGIDSVVRAGEPVDAEDCPTGAWQAPVAMPALGGSYVTRVCFRGESFRPGDGMNIPILNYEVTAEGTTDQRGARVRLVQGYSVRGAVGR